MAEMDADWFESSVRKHGIVVGGKVIFPFGTSSKAPEQAKRARKTDRRPTKRKGGAPRA